MGDFNHGHIQWTSLQSTGREDQEFLNLVQDSFLSQHVLEATRGENVLDIVLSTQKEFVDNVKVCEPLGCSDHNQKHFIIKVKREQNRKIRYRKNFHKGRYKDMREYLAKIDWNKTLKNKTATECWNILKSEIDCVVDKFVPLKKQGKRSKKKHLSKEDIRKIKYKQIFFHFSDVIQLCISSPTCGLDMLFHSHVFIKISAQISHTVQCMYVVAPNVNSPVDAFC